MSDLGHRIAELERQAAVEDIFQADARRDAAMPSTMQNVGDAFLSSLGKAYDMETGTVEVGDRRFASSPDREQMNVDVALSHFYDRRIAAKDTAGHARALCSFALAAYARGREVTESPIERDLLPWIITADWSPALVTPAPVALPAGDLPPFETDIIIVPQFVVGPFRLDFAVCIRKSGKLLIIAMECDGVEFHDVTKDQRRDALLHAAGIHTVRASGREIKGHPLRVVGRARHIAAEWGVVA